MQVFVVQPPNPPPVLPGPRVPAYVPNPAVLNLVCFLQYRGRHTCRVVDANLLSQPMEDIAAAVTGTPGHRLLLVHAGVENVVETARTLAACGGAEGSLRVALFGTLPTHAPRIARRIAPHAYLLRGDPELALKAFLDYVDLPQRLEKIPGLAAPGSERFPAPAWLETLKGFSFDALQSVSWLAAPREKDEIPHDTTFRLTRGNTGLPPDRDFPGAGEPLRRMDLREMGSIFEKCAYWGVSGIHLADPPGIWTPELLQDWLTTLDTQRNTMSWSLQMLPALLDETTLQRMRLTECRQVRFLIPSARPEVMASYGCILRPRAFAGMLRLFRRHGVEASLECWLGGPDEPPAEEERLFEFLRSLGYPDFTVAPFPCRPDAPRQRETDPEQAMAALAADADAAEDPAATQGRPQVWDGARGAERIRQTAENLEARLKRSLVWSVKRNWDQWNPFAWIRRLEELSSGTRG